MPERHLGLVPVEENQERSVIAHMGEVVAKSADLDKIIALARSAAPLPQADTLPLTSGQYNCRIGVAKDEAFSFYYPASLKVLERLGAEIVTFSPLHDHEVPPVDGLLIGGGFPEMFAAQLAANTAMRQAIYGLAQKGMPILAECGGYMYMKESLQDFAGNSHAMVGALPGRTEMTAKLQMVGYVEAELTADSVLGRQGEKIRGHEFHFSQEQAPAEETAAFIFRKLRNNTKYPAGRRFKNVLGSYLHLHFAGCPQAAVNFVSQCAAYRQKRGQDNGKI
jgi:cobyrinic acid a,c-diamide synthase